MAMNSLLSSSPPPLAACAHSPGIFVREQQRNQRPRRAFWGRNLQILARFGGLFTFCLLLGGCTSAQPKTRPLGERVIVRKQHSETWIPQLGRITLVDEPAQFVLLDIGTAPAPSSGTMLRSHSNQGPTAELEVSRFQKRPFLIADIKSGHPQFGDRVFVMQGAQGDTSGKGSEPSERPSEPSR